MRLKNLLSDDKPLIFKHNNLYPICFVSFFLRFNTCCKSNDNGNAGYKLQIILDNNNYIHLLWYASDVGGGEG